MLWVCRAINVLGRFLRRQRAEEELDEEVRTYFELSVAREMEKGFSREEAQRLMRIRFGGPEQVKHRVRQSWTGAWAHAVFQDLLYAWRAMKERPGYALAAICTLALGVGANTAVFSVLDSVLLKPLHYPKAQELVAIRQTAPGAAGLTGFSNGLLLSPSMYFTYATHNRTFQSLGVWTTGTADVTGLAEPEQVRTVSVSDGVLQALHVPPAIGRWLSRADQIPHGARAVMLSYGYWQRRFGGDRSVIGRHITVDSQSREIVGVMPRGFRIVNADFDLIVPLAFDRSKLILAGFGYRGIARLKPGVTIAQADADLARMVPVWMDSWSNGPGTNSHFYEIWRITPAIRPLKQEVVGNVGRVLWVIMGTLGIVMLIACANVANLVLVRADARQQELAIRAALGASRGRIIQGLLLESMLLASIAGALGVELAYAGLRLLVAIGPANLPRLSEISLNMRALGFTLVLSLLSGLLFGLFPALKYAGRRISLALRSAGRAASMSRERHRSRNLLVVAQVAMALVLVVSAGLMIRTFQALRTVEPGFTHADHLQTMRISIPASLIAEPQRVTRIQNNIADKLGQIPGVTSVGFASALPMEEIAPNWDAIYPEGKIYPGASPPLRLFEMVSPGFFHTMGTRLVAGRELTWTDVYDLRPVVLVSENVARALWGTPSAALGKRIREYPSMPWHEVIGVVGNVHENGVQEPPPAIVYWPSMMKNLYRPHSFAAVRTVTFVVRSNRAGTAAFLNEIRKAVWSVNASLPAASMRTMQDIYDQSLARTSFTLAMLGIAGIMALALGIVGIYGVISYAVSQRTREIGIRLALGAQQSEIKRMFVRSGLMLAGIGVAIGLFAAVTLMRLMKSLLFGISPLDPITYIAAPIVLLAAAVLASYLPARRAVAVDPMEALKEEG